MERKFTNYSMDEVCAIIDCSEGIFDALVSEIAVDLLKIQRGETIINSITS